MIKIQIKFLIHLVLKLIVHTKSLRYRTGGVTKFASCEVMMNFESSVFIWSKGVKIVELLITASCCSCNVAPNEGGTDPIYEVSGKQKQIVWLIKEKRITRNFNFEVSYVALCECWNNFCMAEYSPHESKLQWFRRGCHIVHSTLL